MRDIGKNIKELRQLKNMTQDELAEKLFVTRQTVSNYETGKSRPDVEMLMQIADVLNTDLNTILYGLAQQADKERRILKLCISVALLVVCWIGYVHLSDLAKEIAHSTYDMRLSLGCSVFGGPIVPFLFGWTAMQALSVFAKLVPLKNPWSKRLRWIVLWTVIGYLLISVPLIFVFIFPSNVGDIFLDAVWNVWYYLSNWVSGYIYGMHIAPRTLIFLFLGCALWLGVPQKTKE